MLEIAITGHTQDCYQLSPEASSVLEKLELLNSLNVQTLQSSQELNLYSGGHSGGHSSGHSSAHINGNYHSSSKSEFTDTQVAITVIIIVAILMCICYSSSQEEQFARR